jgi:hypothetical protein
MENRAAPSAIQTIGSDSGRLLIANGSHATRAIRNPIPVSTRMYGSTDQSLISGIHPNDHV